MRPELRTLTARRLIKALEKDGFELIRSRGGHRVYYHSNHRIVVVSFHRSGDVFPVGTLQSILKSTGWKDEDLKRLKLIK